jgi:hypothetical protein
MQRGGAIVFGASIAALLRTVNTQSTVHSFECEPSELDLCGSVWSVAKLEIVCGVQPKISKD